jgi:hypothetical protein
MAVNPDFRDLFAALNDVGANLAMSESLLSPEGAQECSPRRQPWEDWIHTQAPEGRKKVSGQILSPLRGLGGNLLFSPGLRRGLSSHAPPGLDIKSLE